MTTQGLVRESWLALWRAMRVYHRYTVDGFEHVAEPGPALVVGYHARGFATDLCLLAITMHERLGYLPHAVFHDAFGRIPLLASMLDAIGGVTGDGTSLDDAVARGEHVVVLPGGTREAFQPALAGARVDWGDRTGYLRLAFRLGVPLLPVASAGAERLYFGLNDGYELGKRFGIPLGIPLWAGVGPFGLFPLSLPWPIQLRQVVGKRIPLDVLGTIDPSDPEAMLRLHRHVVSRVQALLDGACTASDPAASPRSQCHA